MAPALPVVLRRAGDGDIDALVQLHLDTVLVAYRDFFPPHALAPDHAALRPLWEMEVRDADAVWVAVDGDADAGAPAVVGSAVARSSGELGRLHVHPRSWGRGIGTLLHHAAVDSLFAAGHDEIGLWVIDGNARARALYERSGWTLDPDGTLTELGVVEVRYELTRAAWVGR